MYETTAWRISCERGRTKWTETYYSATEESARAMIEFTYPGVVIHSIEPGGAPRVSCARLPIRDV
jgi:hypothetical protein